MKSFAIIFLTAIFAAAAAAQSTGTITGRVAHGSTIPLHGVTVQIVEQGISTRTDEDGIFRLENVPAGRHTVLAHIEGFADSTAVVTVTAGGTVTRDFSLEIASFREEVTVTASGTEQTVFESFQTVNSVGSTRIMERAATSIGEVLEHETGVAKRSFGPGSARPVIRGFDGDRVLVLQDGVRNGSVGSQSGDHGEPIDPLKAERIEVVKGPATLLYGSNALGGVVNVISHHHDDYHDGFRGYFTGVAGSADRQLAGSGGVEYGYKNWLFRGSFGSQRNSDYETPLGRVPNSAGRSATGSFGTGYYTDKAFINGSYNVDIRRYGVPFAALFHEHEEHEHFGEFPEMDEDIDLRLRRSNFRLTGGFRDLGNSFVEGVNYNVDYTDYRHKEIEVFGSEEEVGTIFDNKIFSYRATFEQQGYDRLTGRFGFEGFTRDYLVEGEEQLINGEIKHNSFSAFALEELNFGRVKFQFGGRVENNRYKAEDPMLNDRNFTAFSGGAGINVGLWEGGAIVANYTHSNRAPALEELYNFGPHIGNVTFEIGNDALRRETANGIDLSLRHLSRRFRLTGDVYYYRINDYIFLAPQDSDGDGEIDFEDGLPVGRYEQADAEYVGAELSAEAMFNDYVGAFASLDTVRAKLTDGTDLPRIPPARARVGLDLRYRGLSVRPEAIFAAAQRKTFPLETPTAGYGIVNVAGSYTIGSQHVAHIFSVNAYNLTNKLYRNHVSFIKDLVPEIGRGIRFGYTVRLF